MIFCPSLLHPEGTGGDAPALGAGRVDNRAAHLVPVEKLVSSPELRAVLVLDRVALAALRALQTSRKPNFLVQIIGIYLSNTLPSSGRD